MAHQRVTYPVLEDDIEVPVDLVLYCPECGYKHIDRPNPISGWLNPPHRSHVCHRCRCQWRPADVATNGVAHINTHGEKDTWVNRERNFATTPFNLKQTIHALERSEESLRFMGDKLLAELDYSAEFPLADADLIKQLIELLKQD